MLSNLIPVRASNDYRGARLALWGFVLLTAVTLVRSLIHVVAPDGGAQSIATIPLEDFTPNGAAAVVHLFALWGLSQLLLGIVYVVVLWRYRNLIPMMYLLVVVEYAGRLLIGFAKPLELAGTAPGAVGNYIFVPLGVGMLILSLRNRHTA